jgi:F0F1-type ATP synthase assembly protein I
VFLGLGSLNAVSWLTGFLLGWLADDRWHTAPLFVVLGLLAGVGLGAVASYKEVRRYLRQ